MELTKNQERCLYLITAAIVVGAVTDLLMTISFLVRDWVVMPRYFLP